MSEKKLYYDENGKQIEEPVIYDWKVDSPDYTGYDNTPSAYMVTKHTEADGGCVIYGQWKNAKIKGNWDANPWSTRPLVKHLIEEKIKYQEALQGILDAVKLEEDIGTQLYITPSILTAIKQARKIMAL